MPLEPRCRLGNGDHDFPGFLSAPQTVGDGRTAVLRGAAVVEVSEPVPGESTYWREAFFDMTDSCNGFSPFSDLANLVIEVTPVKSIREDERPPLNVFEGTPEAVSLNRAIRMAGLKASVFMASAAKGSEPNEVATFDLPSRETLTCPESSISISWQFPICTGNSPWWRSYRGSGTPANLDSPK
ncbi:hypothetical protein CM1200mP19_2630 [bacterium]|nr:MAG: hypothetical protein CM1200mP19_2630 [bacterium]